MTKDNLNTNLPNEADKPAFLVGAVRRSYYFVFYKCKRYGWKPKEMGGTSTGCVESECQAIIDKHPIQFQLDCNDKYGKEHETSGGYTCREEYKVVSWTKISKTEYDKYNGMVG